MELVAYIRLFRKWFWLLLLSASLAGSAAFLSRSQQPKQYQAEVTLAVGSFIQAPNPNTSEIYTGERLAQTYAVLAKSHAVLDAAMEAGDFPTLPPLSTRVIENTSLVVLTVTYTDPVLAVDMANEVATQLILNSPSNLTPEQQSQIDLATAEIDRLNEQLQRARLQLSALDSQLETATDPAEIERLTEQYNTTITQINQASATIAQFSNTITNLQQRTNSLDVVEPARIVGATGGRDNTVNTTLLGAAVGVALAVGIALLVEYLDDTIRTPQEATEVLALPALAAIPRFGKRRDSYPQRLITHLDPSSPVSEEYRALRTNMMFSSNGRPGKGTYVITSPGPTEGKSVTAANVAVAMAMAGWRVLLIDADLRRPRIHEIFNLDNNVGLSTLLSAEASETLSASGETQELPRDLKKCLKETEIPGLRVITSGYIPLNPTEVLGSVAMQRWFQEFRSSTNVDIILFDTPPSLVVADSSVLASSLKVPIVLVLEAGETRSGAALRAKEKLVALDVDIKGIVLNAVNPRDGGYNYGYNYYYYYKDSKARSRPLDGTAKKR